MRLVGLWMLAAVCLAQDWAQWRGPSRTGVAAGFKAPAVWPKQLTKVWSSPSGGGFSTPIAGPGAVYVFGRDGSRETVQALERASGKTLWRTGYDVPFEQNQYASQMGRGPNSTPLLHEGRLYTLGITAVLSCLDARTGAVVWRKDYSARVNTKNLFTGTAMSPVIDSGLLIVHVGDDRKGSLVALDPATGAQKWIWEGDGAGYASPVIAEWNGVRQLITLSDRRGIGVSVREGKLLWSIGFKDQWIENIVSPVVDGRRVIFSGVRRGTVCVEIAQKDGQWTARTVWENPELTMYMSSPLLDGGRLYGMTNKKKGQIFCLDSATGKLLWTTTGREGANVSMVSAGDLMLLLNETGDLKIARRNPGRFEPVADYKVADQATWAQPVVLGRNLLIRDAASVTMYRLP
ncbi:MAG: PQQ-binding-like beta-propeller repeat protein [Bryobacteraceae bacterium]|nr:PQQ-binding-like beta-propeller repeat protein [Bryobacteraceae bacterium]